MNRPALNHQLRSLSRIALGLPLFAFGLQYLLYWRLGAGLGTPWTPSASVPSLIAGVILILSASALCAGGRFRVAALAPALFCLLRALVVEIPRIVAAPRVPGPWTSCFELLAIAGACLAAADRAAMPKRAGRTLFALSLVVFGVQHLLYGPFVAALICAWIPAKLFWAYFTGATFFAAAAALLADRAVALAAGLLGLMFFLWVILLHAPRVAAAPHNANEWTSLLVAFAMSGGAFVLACLATPRRGWPSRDLFSSAGAG